MVTLGVGITPKRGNNAIGSNAVAGMAMASVIQNVAIKAATAATFRPSGDIPGGTGDTKKTTNNAGPRINPNKRRLLKANSFDIDSLPFFARRQTEYLD